uniref:Chemokine (C-C motif) ligand 36, duplicate 1 n=1 Tax=Pygocentrus nattereri TaxID=42514 RepID=A0AAR2L0Y3_PYGNA
CISDILCIFFNLLHIVACLFHLIYGKSPEECCFNFFKKPVPVRSIVSYEETRDDCPKAGVIFITKKAARICVDPGFKWVKRAIDQIDIRNVESSTGE